MQTKATDTRLLKAAILTMSFVQMGTNGIAPILAQIAAAFPGASASSIQFLMTFPSIFCVVCTLLAALLAEKLPKRTLALAGLSIVSAAGVLACAFHGSLAVLFLWAALLGVGIGMVAPIAPSLISELFDGPERSALMGQQNSAANVGSMLMTFLGGFLAAGGWWFGYLVYLLALPGLLLTLRAVPAAHGPRARQGGAGPAKGRLHLWREMAIAFVFLMLFSSGPANLAMLVAERGIGGTALAGTMSTLFLLGGTICGLFYGAAATRLGDKTVPLGALMLAAGFLLVSAAPGAVPMGIGCLVAGGSISMVMPACMMGASRQAGRQTLASALVLGSSNVGVFVMPLLTSATALLTGSDATAPRFVACAAVAALLAAATALPHRQK